MCVCLEFAPLPSLPLQPCTTALVAGRGPLLGASCPARVRAVGAPRTEHSLVPQPCDP